MNIREFTQHKFDVLVMLLAFVVLGFFLFHSMHHNADSKVVDWLLDKMGIVLGAILFALQAQIRGARKMDGNGAVK